MAACLLASCFDPKLDFANGALACDNGACPPGYECRADQRCAKTGAPTGGDAATGSTLDGPVTAMVDAATGRVVDAPVGSTSPDAAAMPPAIDAPPSRADAPAAECIGTEKSCASSIQPRHCLDGHWIDDNACGHGTVCSNGDCVSSCTPDPMTTTCNGKCGTLNNNCGTPVTCGDTCAADHNPFWACNAASHTCECVRNVTADCAGKCGPITDRCGVTVNCSGAGNGGVPCTGTGQVCLAGNTCCTQDPIAVTCPGTGGASCSATTMNNCHVAVDCSASCDSDFPCNGSNKLCQCTAGSKRCVPNGSGGTAEQTCVGGTSWGNQATCPFVCTNGTGCSGSCVPTNTQCQDPTHLQTCNGGGTFDTTSCSGGTPVCHAFSATQASCVACDPGSFRCSGSARQQCAPDGSGWTTVENCTYTCTVGGAGPVCSGECHPGDTRCSGGGIQTCGGNFFYGGTAPCPDQLTCGTGIANTCSCSPGATLCQNSTTIRTCNGAGTGWTNATSCATGCSGSSCCSSLSDYCAVNRRCDVTTNTCGVTMDCSEAGPDGTCGQRYPGQHYACGLTTPGQCTCNSSSDEPCNGSFCNGGDWIEEPQCDGDTNEICCVTGSGSFCTPAQTGCP